MKKTLFIFWTFAVVLLLSGCATQKKMVYFYGLTSADSAAVNRAFGTAPQATIAKGDILTIIISSLHPSVAEPFNNAVSTYIIDNEGAVTIPTLGKVQLLGLNRQQAIDVLTEKLQPHLEEPDIILRFENFKVNVMGEVNRPGQYKIDNERVTVLDALTMAGDLTIYGQRDNILIIRENNGKLQFGRLSMNDKNLFASPFYYLQQNDVVYIEPNKQKIYNTQNSWLVQALPATATVAAAVTIIIFLANYGK